MSPLWTERPVLPFDAGQIAAHACYREEDVHRRPGYAAWVAPRIEAARYLGATPDGRSLYAALGFVDYPAEMRRRV